MNKFLQSLSLTPFFIISFICFIPVHNAQEFTCSPIHDSSEILCNGVPYLPTGEIHYDPPSMEFFLSLFGSLAFILFGGAMSGLTIGLLSLDVTTLNVIAATSESEKERRNAKRIIPLVKKPHLVLVSLVLGNAIANEALPIFLDRIVPSIVAIVISVTAILFFGEVIPQALCKKYGISIAAKVYWLVRFLIILFFPIGWPVSKLLDYVLGEGNSTYFQRVQLKELVKLHGELREENEEPLTHNEIRLIRAVLEIHAKRVEEIMTPIEDAFMLPDDALIDEKMIHKIKKLNHSRIPVYSCSDSNDIIGIILVKSLLTTNRQAIQVAKDIAVPKLLKFDKGTAVFPALNQLLAHHFHLSIVYDGQKPVGIITMEDIIEELIQQEIENESFVLDPSGNLGNLGDGKTEKKDQEKKTVNKKEKKSPGNKRKRSEDRPVLQRESLDESPDDDEKEIPLQQVTITIEGERNHEHQTNGDSEKDSDLPKYSDA